MNTTDESFNNENINILAEHIEVMLRSHGVACRKTEITEFLDDLRKTHGHPKMTE
jgi:hypothetical protein